MKFIVDNCITAIDYTEELLTFCKQFLILDNPDFYKKERMGKWTGNTPREIWLFEKDADTLRIPFGMVRQLWSRYPDASMWESRIQPVRQTFYQSGISLYDYQEKAVREAVSMKNGILVMPCGAGKTQCGLEIISRIGGKALWLTHTQDLLNQSEKRAESVLNQGGYGTITAGKVNIGTHITFATIQTMCKLDLSKYADTWDVVICDEAQHISGSPTRVTQFYKVLSNLSARYKYGITATPKRADGLEASMFALLGGKIYEVTRDDVKDTTCPIKVQFIDTGYTPNTDVVLMGDGTIDYAKVIDNMIHDDGRYKLVFTEVAKLEGATMVLANRVEYLQRMSESLRLWGKRCVCLSGQGQSKKAKAERKQALEALNNGEIDCIFASYMLASEGLDVPNLRNIVFATPEKNPTTVAQAAGRVGRKADGKSYGTVIDFVDDFGMYKGWWKKRLSVYKKIGCDIIE